MKEYKALKTDAVSELEKTGADTVLRLAGECMVLLENDGTLPLSDAGRIALYGNGARATIKGGTGSGDVNSRTVVNIESGLEREGFTVSTKKWLDEQDKTAAAELEAYHNILEEKSKQLGVPAPFLAMSVPYIPKKIAPVSREMIAASDTDTAVYGHL